jgi:hypothetical protein
MVTDMKQEYSARKKLALRTKGNESSSWATPQASDHIEGARTAKESNQKCLGRDLNQMNWPTPRTCGGSRPNGKGGKILDEEVKIEAGIRERGKILAEEAKKNWPTPRETMSRDATYDRGKCNLGEVVHGIENQHNGLPVPEKSNMTGKNHGSWPTARSSDAEGGRIKTEKTEKGFRSKREKSDQYFGAKLRDAAEMEKPPTMKLNPNWVEQLMGLPIGWTDLGSWATESSPKPQN